MYLELREFYGLWKAKENMFFICLVNVFPLDDYEWENEKSNKIVLIGKDLDHQTIKNQLDCCRFNS